MRSTWTISILVVWAVVAGCSSGAQQQRAAATGPSAPAGPGPEATTGEVVLERAKRAAGANEWDNIARLRLEGQLIQGELEGTFATIEELSSGRFYTTYTLGPLSGAEGFDGKQGWYQDQDGSVNVSTSRDVLESSANEAYRIARAYWYPERWPAEVRYDGEQQRGERRFHVVHLHPQGGRPFQMWIDAGTWLIDHTVEQTAMEPRTTFFSDYRNVSGIALPHLVRVSRGEQKYDQTVHLDRVELNPEVAAAKFEVPAEKMTDFAIAGDKDRAELPFELLNNHIYVKARLNGQPLNLLVDTGGANIITPTVAQSLGLESQGKLPGRGTGEKTVEVGLTRVDTLGLGDVEMRDQKFYVVPMEEMSRVEGVSFDGLVGYEVFKRFVVTIDYVDRRLILQRPESFEYRGGGTAVPFVFEHHIPEVEDSIDGIEGKFSIDTGSRGSLTLHGPFVEKHRLVEKYQPKVKALAGWGVGGGVSEHLLRAERLVLGEVEIPGPVTGLFTGTKGAGSDRYVAGNVGGGVLKRFTVTFDYKRQLMYLEKNRNFDQTGNWDRSGIWINHEGDAFVIKDVVEGSPADQAGLNVGDRILAVDGKKVGKLSLSETRERLRNSKVGTRIKLRVKSTAKTHRVTLVLQELI